MNWSTTPSPIMRRPSIATTIESTPTKIRHGLRRISGWRGPANAPYSPVLSFGLLLVLGLAATIGH